MLYSNLMAGGGYALYPCWTVPYTYRKYFQVHQGKAGFPSDGPLKHVYDFSGTLYVNTGGMWCGGEDVASTIREYAFFMKLTLYPDQEEGKKLMAEGSRKKDFILYSYKDKIYKVLYTDRDGLKVGFEYYLPIGFVV